MSENTTPPRVPDIEAEAERAKIAALVRVAEELRDASTRDHAEDKGKRGREKLSLWLLFVTFFISLAAALVTHWDANQAKIAAHIEADNAVENAHDDSLNATMDAASESNNAIANATNDSMKALQKATEANNVAQTSAENQEKLTRASNDINLKAFTLVQRAFVINKELLTTSAANVDQSFGEHLTDIGNVKHWTFSTILENSGNTPTANLRVYPIISWAPPIGPSAFQTGTINKHNDETQSAIQFVPLDPADLVSSWNSTPVRNVIGPHNTFKTPAFIFSDSFLRSTSEKHLPVYIFGVAYYNDVLSPKQTHITKWCYHVGGISGFFGSDGTGDSPETTPCAHWNCVDDECAVDKAAFKEEVDRLRSPFMR